MGDRAFNYFADNLFAQGCEMKEKGHFLSPGFVSSIPMKMERYKKA